MQKKSNRRLSFASVLILVAIPMTIAIGMAFLHDQNYYLISTTILIATMLPFFLVFDHRKTQVREIVLICSLAAIAVISRCAFFMIPEIKPIAAIVIISAICLGPESGFLVGALAEFVSNFFFGQGPWTPWQMFSYGIVGFLAGLLYRKKILRPNKASICIFGALATFVVYGGLMNLYSVLTLTTAVTKESVAAVYLSGIPFDLVHAGSTALFLFLIGKPMVKKINRIRMKYGLIDEDERQML